VLRTVFVKKCLPAFLATQLNLACGDTRRQQQQLLLLQKEKTWRNEEPVNVITHAKEESRDAPARGLGALAREWMEAEESGADISGPHWIA
jgi:hypothetical protein